MVIRYSINELNAIGEKVLIRECIARMPEYTMEPQYHQVFVPDEVSDTIIAAAQSTTSSMPNSISADKFLQDFAQFQLHLDQAIQFNRDTSWRQQRNVQMSRQQQKQSGELSESVAEFFRKVQQNFYAASATSNATADIYPSTSNL